MKRFIAIALAVSLAACSAAGVSKVSSVAAQIQPTLITACNAAMMLAPLAGPVAPWIVGGCGTVEAVDKLAADPTSTAWVNGLIAMVSGGELDAPLSSRRNRDNRSVPIRAALTAS